MAKNKIYIKTPPVKEVVCNFFFSKDIGDEAIKKIRDVYAKENTYDLDSVNLVNFSIDSNGHPSAHVLNRINLSSKDKSFVVKIGYNNISFHQLGSYTKWSDFSPKIKDTWFSLSNIIDLDINSVSIKKINTFSFDSNINLSDYFNGMPQISKSFFFEDSEFSVNYNKLSKSSFIELLFFCKKTSDQLNIVLTNAINTQIEYMDKSISFDLFQLLSDNNDVLYDVFVSVLTKEYFSQLQ